MAGFLALPDKSAFPTLFTIRCSLLISAAPVASSGLTIIGITVAGTAQVFHLIPFYCADETPVHHHFGCKDTHYFIYMQFFHEKSRILRLVVIIPDE
jgi:hypothetical protein